jgi:hypothetical protein
MQLQIRHGRMCILDELENGYDLFQACVFRRKDWGNKVQLRCAVGIGS